MDNDSCLSPSSRAKLKNRNAAMELKHGSPKLREILRQRCRIRIRSRREALVNSFRNISISQNEVSAIVKEELIDLCNNFPEEDSGVSSQCSMDDHLQENAISDEILNLENQIIMEECQYLLNDDDYIQHMAQLLNDEVVCPVCMKGMLRKVTEAVAECEDCKQGVQTPGGIKNLQRKCFDAASAHEEQCRTAPNFIKITDTLYLACLDCSYLEPVI